MSIAAVSPSLIIAVSVQLLSQAFKVVYYSLKEGGLQLHRFVHPAGMPSAHAAFVAALTSALAVYHGIDSDLFALSFVFSAIVIYDTLRLRGAVQVLCRLVDRLARKLPEIEREAVPQYIGHNALEIAVGVVIGCVWGIGWSLVITPGW